MITEEQFIQSLLIQRVKIGGMNWEVVPHLQAMGYTPYAIVGANDKLLKETSVVTLKQGPDAVQWLGKFSDTITEEKLIRAIYWQCFKVGLKPKETRMLISDFGFKKEIIMKALDEAKDEAILDGKEINRLTAPSAIEILGN